ncbi:MAG: hypothetical protein GH148_09700 [Clostridia bacterium]|nr:hypothetical protein [Clostridia bacterium]
MSKKRFSKLQKWILATCYQLPNKMIARRDIIGRRFSPIKGWVTGFFEERTPTIDVVLSNSIWNLISKGLITGLSLMKLSDMARLYNKKGKSIKDFENDCLKRGVDPTRERKITVFSMKGKTKVKIIKLTNRGEIRAKELLKAKL